MIGQEDTKMVSCDKPNHGEIKTDTNKSRVTVNATLRMPGRVDSCVLVDMPATAAKACGATNIYTQRAVELGGLL